MKIAPLAAGTSMAGVSLTGASDTVASPERKARAKMIASGQIVPQEAPPVPQENKQDAQVRKIKMRTQVSTNRHETQVPVEEPVAQNTQQGDTSDNNEPAQRTEETRTLSPELAAIARQRRALQVKEREIAQREEAIKAQAPKEQVDWKANLKANPLSVLQEAGVTYDQLTEAILANQNSPSFDPKVIDDLVDKKLAERLDKEFGTRDTAQEQQVLANIKLDVDSLVKDNEQFELIQGEQAQQDVVGLIHRVFKQGWPEQELPAGTVLSTDQAAQFVEDFLLDQAIRPTTYKKVQSRLAPKEDPAAAQTSAPQPKPGVQVMRTLTNRVSNTQAPLDKRARALAAFTGTLKR